MDETSPAVIEDDRASGSSTARLEGLYDEMDATGIGVERVDSAGSELRIKRNNLPAFG